MAKTLRERFAEALSAKGEQQIESRSGKFLTFTRTKEGVAKGYYFLGKSGSLRVGMLSSKSIPVSDKFKNELLGI